MFSPDEWTRAILSRRSASRPGALSITWVMPRMPFSGVRISWLVVARNSVRAFSAFSSAKLATLSRPLAARTSLRLRRIHRKLTASSTPMIIEAISSTVVITLRDLASATSRCNWPAFSWAMRVVWLAKSNCADISAALVEAARSRASSSRRLKASRWASARR